MAKNNKKSIEEMFSDIAAQLSTLTPLVDGVKKLTDKVDELEKTMKEIKKENALLKNDIAERDLTISNLQSQLNDAQQHNRQWSIRVLDLPVPETDRNNNIRVKQLLYRTVLLPILEGAASKGDISDIPSCDQLIERAHILPSPPGKPPAVIARFYCRDYKDLVFKHKKEFQPTSAALPATRANRTAPRPRPLYPIYEDLTRATFLKMRALSTNDAVHSAWSTAGTIKYRLKSDTNIIHKVRNVYSTVESILGNPTA